MAFSVERTHDPDTLLLIGELDISTAHLLRQAVEDDPAPGDEVTLDLSRLTFMDSVGLLALIGTANRLDGGHLRLVSPQRQVQLVLEVTGIGRRPNVEIV